MKISLNLVASVSLNKVDWNNAENICIAAIKRFVSKTLKVQKRFSSMGAGTGFGRRDVSGIISLKESEVEKIVKRIPTRKAVFVDGVKIEVDCIRLQVEGKGFDAEFKAVKYFHENKWYPS